MIKLLLADDDALFRAQFHGLADWERAGFHIAAEARNGREAIAEIERVRPDIVLTDISMPVLDGIGVIDYIRQHHPSLPVIALSAFDDFQYVRSSLKKGAQDYLLKHRLDGKQLLSMLKTMVENFDGHEQTDVHGRRDVEAFYFLVLADWFEKPEALDARAKSLGISLPANGFFPIVARIDDVNRETGSNGEAGLSDAMLGMLREILGRSVMEIVRLTQDSALILYPAAAAGWQAAPYREDLELASANLRRFFGQSISFGVGNRCGSLYDLPAGYKQACARYDKARFLGGTGFIAQDDAPVQRQDTQSLSIGESQKIMSLLHVDDAQALTRELTAIFARLEQGGCCASDLTFVYAELIHILLLASQDFDLPTNGSDVPPLNAFRCIGDMRLWFIARFEAVRGAARAREGRSYGEYTRAAIQYMRKHYGRKISLRDVAAALNINASYLSRLFKEETGENLTNWLNALRMDEAERLLAARELSIREIAARVGIDNYNHFFTLFRENRGVTPSEYRKRVAMDRTTGQ